MDYVTGFQVWAFFLTKSLKLTFGAENTLLQGAEDASRTTAKHSHAFYVSNYGQYDGLIICLGD